MRAWTSALMVGFSLLWSLVAPSAEAATCTGVCNPDSDVCCKDDCTWETDPQARCIPPGEACRTKKCNPTTHACDVGSFNALPVGADCFSGDPCLHGTCNGSAQCVNQTVSPCEDAQDCTVDSAACYPTGPRGWACDYTRPGATKPDDTPCAVTNPVACKTYTCVSGVCSPTGNQNNGTACGALISASTCAVKSCADGECTGAQVGSPVPCTEEPCRSRSCKFQNGVVSCVKTNKLRGTVCDTDPWDCKHQRCNADGECKDRDTTTLKECDADPSTPSHCKLSYCDSNKNCRTDPSYHHTIGADNVGPGNAGVGFGRWLVEAASTPGRNNRKFVITDPCPASDSNICTSDRCNGGGVDACHLYLGTAPGEPAAGGCEAGWHCGGDPSCALLCSGTGTDSSCVCQ
jgi:hypothetical protein